MRRLQIYDLSFCETVNSQQVKGGLSARARFNILDMLSAHIPEFVQTDLEIQEGYLIEKFGDEEGKHYGYRISSQDGRKRFGGATGRLNHGHYAVSFSETSS